MISRGSWPGVPTAMPSAMLLAPCGCEVPLMALNIAGKRCGLHADDADARLDRFGRRGNAAHQARRHPQQSTSVSSSGTAVQHLQAHGALASDDQRVVVGVNQSQALAGWPAPARGCAPRPASRRAAPPSAPRRRVFSTLTPGVNSGITITARSPRRAAWWATPCAWLPALMATTPLQVARSSVASLLHAPRSLKLAVNCRFSNFRYNCAPGNLRERFALYTGRVQHLALQARGGGLDIVQSDHLCIVRKNSAMSWLMCGEFHTCERCK